MQINTQPQSNPYGPAWWLQSAGLAAIAVGGSLFYGESLARVMPALRTGGGPFLVAICAGFAWCVFGPLLIAITRLPILRCAHICLVSMAYGEAVLCIGAVLNLIGTYTTAPAAANIACVLISDVVMAAVFTLQLRTEGVSPKTALLLWILALNGVAALLLWKLRGWIGGI